MNEKIRQLAVESGFATGYDRTQTGKWSLSDRELEKFAELIVQECADFADEHNDYSEGVTLGVGRALKKHFGVEE